jgi:hypothetical protein
MGRTRPAAGYKTVNCITILNGPFGWSLYLLPAGRSIQEVLMPKLTPEQLAERRRRRAESEARWREYEATQPIFTGGGGGVRVKLIREVPMTEYERYPYFIGELDGTPIRYHCLYVSNVVAIRRGLAQRGAVWHDAHDSWLELAAPADLPAQEDAAEIPPAELVQLRDAARAGQVGGPTDGRRKLRGAVDPE